MSWLTCCNYELTDLRQLWADLLQLWAGWPAATTSRVSATAVGWQTFISELADLLQQWPGYLLQLCAAWPASIMSWLTYCNYDLLHYKLTDVLELWAVWPVVIISWLTGCNYDLWIWLTCCNYELTPIRSKKNEPIVITAANKSYVNLKDVKSTTFYSRLLAHKKSKSPR
jgi:hypothetical protein